MTRRKKGSPRTLHVDSLPAAPPVPARRLVIRNQLGEDPPEMRWWRRLGYRATLRNKITAYGLQFIAPRRLVPARNRWLLRAGQWERNEASTSLAILRPELPVIEFGAGLGVVSCLVNKALDDPTAHIAVELNPRIHPFLDHNRRINRCEFTPVVGALAYGDPARPNTNRGWSLEHTFDGAQEGVRRLTLGGLLKERGWRHVNLISDCEGAEVGLFEHESDQLRDHVVACCMEFHPQIYGGQKAAELVQSFQRLGFHLQEFQPNNVMGFVKA